MFDPWEYLSDELDRIHQDREPKIFTEPVNVKTLVDMGVPAFCELMDRVWDKAFHLELEAQEEIRETVVTRIDDNLNELVEMSDSDWYRAKRLTEQLTKDYQCMEVIDKGDLATAAQTYSDDICNHIRDVRHYKDYDAEKVYV